MSPHSRFYITTPIYYVNDVPHIGHAYTTLACDVLARFMRLEGRTVKFLTGTDEHGQKVVKSAEAAGKTPQDFTDEVSQRFRELASLMQYSHDDFIRTTESRHIRAAQALWEALKAKGHIYLGAYAGWYSVRDEAFYTESEIVDGKAPTGAPVEWLEEPSYFFDLSQWQEKLLEHYHNHPEFIWPASRRNEVIRFVEGGLKDLSVSRTSFRWGIPIPNDENHVMYVWLDALTNYLSAIGYPDTKHPDYAYWPADIHMVGKDILRFHAVYWPAFLMAAGLPLPKRIIAHGWWTNEGQKISKSLGNVIDPLKLINEFGVDQTRYFLMREVPFGNDGNYSRDQMIQRVNAELANTIGNLAQRTLSLIYKHCDAKIPTMLSDIGKKGFMYHTVARLLTVGSEISHRVINEGIKSAFKYISSLADEVNEQMVSYAYDKSKKKQKIPKRSYPVEPLLQAAEAAVVEVRKSMQEPDFSAVLDTILRLAHLANSYIDEQAPWSLKKTDPVRMEHVLYVLAETIRYIATLLLPFVPSSAGKLLDQLAVPQELRTIHHLKAQYALIVGTPIPQPEAVFPRFIEETKLASTS